MNVCMYRKTVDKLSRRVKTTDFYSFTPQKSIEKAYKICVQ